LKLIKGNGHKVHKDHYADNVSSKEFRIPCTTNGICVSDSCRIRRCTE